MLKQNSFIFLTILLVFCLNIKSIYLIKEDKEYAATSKAFLFLFFHYYYKVTLNFFEKSC